MAISARPARKLVGVIAVSAIVLAPILLNGSPASAAQPPVDLGTAESFAVLAGSTVTNTGPSSISGDLGVSPGTAITGFPPGLVSGGTMHSADAVASLAETHATVAYNDAAGRLPQTAVGTNLGGRTLAPGVYSGATLAVAGALTLDGEGDPNAVFVFKTGSTLITASGSSVNMINGASACNVTWQVGSSATLGTSSTFRGTIVALTSITLNTNATVSGRVLARNGAVTLDSNVITRPACSVAPPTTTTPSTTAPSSSSTSVVATTSTPATTTAPVTTVPTTSIPVTTIPTTSIPVTSIPATTAPVTTIPATTAPVTTVPATTAPATTVPATTVPATTTAPTPTTSPATTTPAPTVPVSSTTPLNSAPAPSTTTSTIAGVDSTTPASDRTESETTPGSDTEATSTTAVTGTTTGSGTDTVTTGKPSTPLARTGSSTRPEIVLGAGALLLGLGMVLVSRRRTSTR